MRSEKVSWIHEHCLRCGRFLGTHKSRLLGYGPVCYKKVIEEEKGQQTEIDDFIHKRKLNNEFETII